MQHLQTPLPMTFRYCTCPACTAGTETAISQAHEHVSSLFHHMGATRYANTQSHRVVGSYLARILYAHL